MTIPWWDVPPGDHYSPSVATVKGKEGNISKSVEDSRAIDINND